MPCDTGRNSGTPRTYGRRHSSPYNRPEPRKAHSNTRGGSSSTVLLAPAIGPVNEATLLNPLPQSILPSCGAGVRPVCIRLSGSNARNMTAHCPHLLAGERSGTTTAAPEPDTAKTVRPWKDPGGVYSRRSHLFHRRRRARNPRLSSCR